jgi:putative flippase GtrA
MPQFMLFAGLGLIGTLAHYLLLVLLVQLLDTEAVAASLAGYALGAIVNFLLSHHVAFRSAARHRETAPRFFVVAAAGFCANWLFMWTLVAGMAVHYLIAQVISTSLTLMLNYMANAIWTFGGRADR